MRNTPKTDKVVAAIHILCNPSVIGRPAFAEDIRREVINLIKEDVSPGMLDHCLREIRKGKYNMYMPHVPRGNNPQGNPRWISFMEHDEPASITDRTSIELGFAGTLSTHATQLDNQIRTCWNILPQLRYSSAAYRRIKIVLESAEHCKRMTSYAYEELKNAG